jgi:hypothetical protein
MIMLEAHCRSGHYLAGVVRAGDDDEDQSGYRVLVFRRGSAVYEEREESIGDAVQTAKAYLRWQAVQDLVLSEKRLKL